MSAWPAYHRIYLCHDDTRLQEMQRERFPEKSSWLCGERWKGMVLEDIALWINTCTFLVYFKGQFMYFLNGQHEAFFLVVFLLIWSLFKFFLRNMPSLEQENINFITIIIKYDNNNFRFTRKVPMSYIVCIKGRFLSM